MLFINLILLLICSNKVSPEVAQVPAGDLAHMFIPHSLNAPLHEPQCNSTVAPQRSLKIHLPFTDVEIQNHRNLHIVQAEGRQHLFVLHGHELFRLFVSRHEKRLVLIGHLGGSVRELEPLGLEIIAWHNYYIVAVALDGFIEIYQISTEIIQERIAVVREPNSRAAMLPTFNAIQQLTLFGRYQKMFLTEPEDQRVMLIVAVNFTKLHGKYRTFEWLNTYFETIEELTVPQIDVPQIVGTYPKYLISGKSIRHQSRIILTIYELQAGSLNLQVVQTITVNGKLIYTSTYRGRNLLVTCEKKHQKCNIFVMRDGQFFAYKRRPWNELAFERFSTVPKHFLVGLIHNEVRIFSSGRLDCFSSFTTPERDASAVLTHANEVSEDYVLLMYKRPFFTLVRLVEVEVIGGRNDSSREGADVLGSALDPDETNTLKRHQHLFEDTIGRLRSVLLKRKMAMDVLRQVGGVFAPKHTQAQVPHAVQIEQGKIGIIQIVGEHLQSPSQIMQRVAAMRAALKETKRMRRSTDAKDLKVNQIKVRNLVYDGSVLQGFFLDNSTSPLPILSVRRKLYARTVKTKELQRNKRQLEEISPPLRVTKLQVQRVNGVNWNELYDMWFLCNRDTKLQGRLILQAASRVQNLQTPMLNGLVVDELFNLRLPQEIHTNILMARFFVRDLRVTQLNGLDFAKDIVFSGRDDFIETPVKMNELSVKGDIEIIDKTKNLREADVQTPELQQYYTKPVIINGSLTVQNLLSETYASQILLGGQPLDVNDIRETFLLQNEAQNFSSPAHFGNAKVFAPALQTKYLNEHPTEQHLLNTETPTQNSTQQKPLYLVLMQSHIEGDLICMDYQTKLRDLQSNAIKHGDVVNITGAKYFEAPLMVDHLMTLQLNALPVQELVLKSHLHREDLNFSATKTFETISVRDECHIEKELKSKYLNNLPLNEMLNYDYYYDSLHVPHRLQVDNAVIHCLNGIPIEEVLSKFKVSDDVLMLHKDLIIEGNVQFSENLQVSHINDIEWVGYEQSLIKTDDDVAPGEILSEVHFTEELSITDKLITPTVNNVVLEEIFENILRKSTAQLITGEYTFDTLELSNVDVSVINGVPTVSFIDLTEEVVEIDGDLQLPKMSVHSEVQGNLSPNLDYSKLKERLHWLTQRQWLNLYVHGDCQWNAANPLPGTQYNRLDYLLKNAVRKSQEQQISGSVHLKSSPRIKKLHTGTQFPIYDELKYIAQDCLLKHSSKVQVIEGAKSFMKPLQMYGVEMSGILSVKMLNGIDVERFNKSLYRVSSGNPIYGPLKFAQSPNIENLYLEGSLNGVRLTDVYHLGQGVIPPVVLTEMLIESPLEIGEINNMNLSYLLENRLTRTGEALEAFGFLTFENLTLNKEILLQSINNIPIDDLVFEKSEHLQAITGTKTIQGDLFLDGPTHLMSLNGADLMGAHQQTVFSDRNYQFDTVIVDEATFEKGLILSEGTKSQGRSAAAHSKRMPYKDLKEILQKVTVTTNLKYLDYAPDVLVLRKPANESTSETFVYELKQSTACERLYMQVQTSGKTFFVSHHSSPLVTDSLNELSVKAENYCQHRYRKVKSKITISSKKLLKVFGMKKHIESVRIFSVKPTESYVLLHGVSASSDKHNEIRVLKVTASTNEVHDIQSLSVGIGRVVRLFTYPQQITLICKSSLPQQPAVNVYRFSEALEKFKLIQTIDGDYDLIELADLPSDRLQLILGCRQCQRLNIYELEVTTGQQEPPPYRVMQIVKVPTPIDRVHVFRLPDGPTYMLVLAANGYDYYHLYKYAYIKGWTEVTYGYYENLKMALPLIKNGRSVYEHVLLLLCGSVDCAAVRAV